MSYVFAFYHTFCNLRTRMRLFLCDTFLDSACVAIILDIYSTVIVLLPLSNEWGVLSSVVPALGLLSVNLLCLGKPLLSHG